MQPWAKERCHSAFTVDSRGKSADLEDGSPQRGPEAEPDVGVGAKLPEDDDMF